MTEWTTIRVRQDAKDDAQERKPKDMTWSEWLRREGYEPKVDIDRVLGRIDDLEAELPRKVAEELRK